MGVGATNQSSLVQPQTISAPAKQSVQTGQKNLPGILNFFHGIANFAADNLIAPPARAGVRLTTQAANLASKLEGGGGPKQIKSVGNIRIPPPTFKQVGGDLGNLALTFGAAPLIEGAGQVAGAAGRILASQGLGVGFTATGNLGENVPVTKRTIAGGIIGGTIAGGVGEGARFLASKLQPRQIPEANNPNLTPEVRKSMESQANYSLPEALKNAQEQSAKQIERFDPALAQKVRSLDLTNSPNLSDAAQKVKDILPPGLSADKLESSTNYFKTEQMALDNAAETRAFLSKIPADKASLEPSILQSIKDAGQLNKPLAQSTTELLGRTIDETKLTPDKAFNINLDHLNIPQESKADLKVIAGQLQPELEKIKGGTLSNDQVRLAANGVDILSRKVSAGQTQETLAQILRTRQSLAALAKEGTITPEYVNTLKIVSSVAADTGRRLQSFNIGADPVLNDTKALIIKKLTDLGKSTEDIVAAAKGVDFNDSKQATAFYRSFVKPSISEIVDEYRYINLLSSPQTHLVNATTNALQTNLVAPATHLVSGFLDFFGSKLTGAAQKTYVAEVPAYYRGMLSSTGDALKGFWDVMNGNKSILRPDVGQIPTNTPILQKASFIPRLLEASDIFFTKLMAGGEREALAIKALKSGQDISPEQLQKEAERVATYWLFRSPIDPQNKTGQGYVLSWIDNLSNAVYKFRDVPGVGWFVPFVRTPMNILKQGLEFSPAGLATLAGASDKTTQLAKSLIGSTVMLGAAHIIASGDSTWSLPTSATEKQQFLASGRQAYSIRFPGTKTWISYSKLGPLAYPIAMAAAWKYYFEQDPKARTTGTIEKASKVFFGMSKFFTDQSYVQGIGNFVNVAQGDTSRLASGLANLPGQLVPLSSLLRWVNRFIDPIVRKPESGLKPEAILQSLETGIPFLSKTLPAQPDISGQPQKRPLPTLNAILPFAVSPLSPGYDKLYRAAQNVRLNTSILNSLQSIIKNKSINQEQKRKQLQSLMDNLKKTSK